MTDAAYAEDQTEGIEFEGLTDDDASTPDDHMADVEKVKANIGAINLAEGMDAGELGRIGAKVVEEFTIDQNSLTEAGWTERDKKAMNLALQVKEAKSNPWPGASNIKYPLISTAAIQFNARAYPAVIDGFNVVKGRVLGSDQGKPKMGPDGQPIEGQWEVQPGQKREKADRISQHMSYQLLEEMDGWEEDTDRLLIMLPIRGCAFRKTYFDPSRGYNCSHLVSPDKFVVNYMTKDLETCPRATHILEFYPHEIKQKVRSGIWLEHDFGTANNAANDDDAPHEFLEQHRLLDLDDDDYPEPYIVTVHKETSKVVRIVARYDEKGIEADQQGQITSIKPVRMFTKYGFIPSPDGSFYDIGFGTLLGAFNESINSTLNMIMDAGHLANTQGGFIGAGVTMKSGSARFSMGEFKRIDTAGATLRDSIMALPAPGPSTVLFNLLTMLIEASKDVTATQDIMTGDTGGSNQPVGTTLAVIEQGLKTFTAIVKRVHRSLKQELACLFRLNSIYLEDQAYYVFQDQEGVIGRQDYAQGDVDVIAVSDPTMATDMQRMARAQFLQQYRLDPLMDGKKINERVLGAAGIQDSKELFAPPPEGPPPELQIQMKEMEHKDRELDQKDIELTIKRDEAEARIATSAAQAQKTAIEAIMMAPEFQAEVAAFIDQRVAQLSQGNDGQVQQPDLRGMAPPPPNGPVPPVPQGPAVGPGPPMDGGPGLGPPGADQGPPDGGVGGPQLG